METSAPTKSAIDEKAITLVYEHVRRLLEKIGEDDIVMRCNTQKDNSLHIAIDIGDRGRALIGPQGAHLFALQHVIRIVLRKHIGNNVYISVDVNGYKEKYEQKLVELARQTAQKALHASRTIVLQPMTSFDRRIIHAALADDAHVTTESLGEEPNRRVVVRPVFL